MACFVLRSEQDRCPRMFSKTRMSQPRKIYRGIRENLKTWIEPGGVVGIRTGVCNLRNHIKSDSWRQRLGFPRASRLASLAGIDRCLLNKRNQGHWIRQKTEDTQCNSGLPHIHVYMCTCTYTYVCPHMYIYVRKWTVSSWSPSEQWVWTGWLQVKGHIGPPWNYLFLVSTLSSAGCLWAVRYN